MQDMLDLSREELHDILCEEELHLNETEIANFEDLWWLQITSKS